MPDEYNHYQILRIQPDASTEEIKEAYRKLSFKYHPDKNQMSLTANQIMLRINEAYTVLTNSVKRRDYDRRMGFCPVTPQFKMGDQVKVNSHSKTVYRDHIGVVNQEPSKDNFRFWYTVKFDSKDFSSTSRFAEEELSKVGE